MHDKGLNDIGELQHEDNARYKPKHSARPGAQVHGCTGARVHGCTGARVHGLTAA